MQWIETDCLPRRLRPWTERFPAWTEFLAFGLLQARACLFAGTFFVVLALSSRLPLGGLPRYDFLLIAALLMQAALLWARIETWDEFKTICLFHVIGLGLEIFKTQPAIGSWRYPEFSYCKLMGVPLYSGFMYAAVASYIVQAWRLLELRMVRYPDYRLSLPLALAIYANFFTHHFIGDYRGWLFAALLLVFGRTRVYFRPYRTQRWMPLVLGFALIGFFIWVAENIATFFGAWVYPDQASGWTVVHVGKVSSWTLLVVISLIVIADLKHIKAERFARGSGLTRNSSVENSRDRSIQVLDNRG
jgi:uncharacterized membrane protein YoaT (DUF817 family)